MPGIKYWWRTYISFFLRLTDQVSLSSKFGIDINRHGYERFGLLFVGIHDTNKYPGLQ